MSSHATFYVQQCPTCGRRLRICVEYLGKSIQCRQCRAVFTACDPASTLTCDEDHQNLLQRVEQLLAMPEPVEQSVLR
jgi:hypothetical protein